MDTALNFAARSLEVAAHAAARDFKIVACYFEVAQFAAALDFEGAVAAHVDACDLAVAAGALLLHLYNEKPNLP